MQILEMLHIIVIPMPFDLALAHQLFDGLLAKLWNGDNAGRIGNGIGCLVDRCLMAPVVRTRAILLLQNAPCHIPKRQEQAPV